MTSSNYSQSDPVAQKRLVWILGIFAAVMCIVAIHQGVKIYDLWSDKKPGSSNHWPVLAWAVLNALLGGGIALALAVVPRESSPTRLPATKWAVLLVGGFWGLTTVVLGVVLAVLWLKEPIGGLLTGRAAWKGGPTWAHWRPYISIATVIAGLGIMFVSLLPARSEVRSNPLLRRLVYGYSTVLNGLLVLANLAMLNVFAFFYGTQMSDWTAANVYDISDQTRQILKGLDQPVNVYVLLPRGDSADTLRADLEAMLETCRSETDQLTVHTLAPEDPRERLAIMRMMLDLDLIPQVGAYSWERQGGVIVTMGEGNKPAAQFLKRDPDLEGGDASAMLPHGHPPTGGNRLFKGEQALVKAINALRYPNENLKVCFIQHNNEMPLRGGQIEPQPDRELGVPNINTGLGFLSGYLEQSQNYKLETEMLQLNPTADTPPRIPDGAAEPFAVVLAGPYQSNRGKPLVDEVTIQALREYMSRPKSKLIVLLDVRHDREFELFPATGLEDFLAEHGIEVGRDVVLNYTTTRQPRERAPSLDTAQVVVSAQAEPSLASAWRDKAPVGLLLARSVRPLLASSVSFQVKPFLETWVPPGGRSAQWSETSPRQFIEDLNAVTSQSEFNELLGQKIGGPPVSVAVTARDASGEPRMVVIGDATLVSDYRTLTGDRMGMVLFSDALYWLRSRPELIAETQAKTRKDYTVKTKPEERRALMWLPPMVLLLGIAACGAGVWFMRRR
jgi:hypothetical protein